MTARQIDEAAWRLRDLWFRGVEELAVGTTALGLALAATQLRPELAVPLLAGAVVVSYLGVVALVRRSFLLEDLAGERDAYVIPAVSRFGRRAVSPSHRRLLAGKLRAARLEAVRPEVEELIAALEDESLCWEPSAGVALERWLDGPAGSEAEARASLRRSIAAFEYVGSPMPVSRERPTLAR
jgi:hypothetical protein